MPNQQPKKPNHHSRPLVLALQAALLAGVALPSTPAWCDQTTRVSVNRAGKQGNGHSYRPSISADGRFVAFGSEADNLATGDTNGWLDIFVRDRTTGATTRVSVANDGAQGNNHSRDPSISADGRFVAFESHASNLVAGDTNRTSDIFVHDRATRKTSRVSVASDGTQGYQSYQPSISADGRFVAFSSFSASLVADDTFDLLDIFVHDRTTRKTTRVSVASDGTQGNHWSHTPSLSADGRFVAFASEASNLVADDTNLTLDIFVHDRTDRTTSRVSVAGDGKQGNSESRSPSISADGRFVAFQSWAQHLIADDTNVGEHIFVRDRTARTTSLVSVAVDGMPGDGGSYTPSISADGRFVAFRSSVFGDNLSYDIFVHDRATRKTSRVSVASDWTVGGDGNHFLSISADGRFVAFASDASNLVADDTNGVRDIFVSDRLLRPAVTADLRVSQTVSANPVARGGVFSYRVTVTNLGPARADNVALTNLGALLFGRASLPTFTPSQGSCRRAAITVCRLGALNAGQQATVQITSTARTPGTVSNRVSVNAAPRDLSPLNNTVTTRTTISR